MKIRLMLACALILVAGCGGETRPDLTTNMPLTKAPAEGDAPGAERKIIFTATIDLAVRDFDQAQLQITSLVDEVGGYVASFREESRNGGHWVVRLPAPKFQRFTTAAAELGVILSRQTDAQDVTEQYIDLNARRRNKQRMEERVLKLLAERPGEIREVLEFESQLARIREEIESVEGKLRYLADHVAMTTVTLTAREDQTYFPPAPPKFADKAYSALYSSLAAMQELGEGILLSVIAAAPWLILGVMLLTPPLWIGIRIAQYQRRTVI